MDYATVSIMVTSAFCLGFCYLQYFQADSVRIRQFNYILITFFILFNPYILDLITLNFQDTLEQISWITYLLLLHYDKMTVLSYFSIGISTLLNPSNGLYALLGLIEKKQKTLVKCLEIIAGISVCFFYFYMFSGQILSKHYYKMYFPQVYEPQFNLLWILYAHMFERYLLLYQIVFIILQINSVYLVAYLNLDLQLKILVLMYFKVYCNYKCSELSMIGTLLVYAILLANHINNCISKWSNLKNNYEVIKLKVLTLITVIANIALFPLEKILLNKYLNDFSINIGYLFLFIGLMWIFNSIYISELVINWTDLEQKIECSQETKDQKCIIQEQSNQNQQQIAEE